MKLLLLIWKGQGEWEEDWGETYAGKRQPALFLIDINSGQVLPVKGIPKSLSTGRVVWAPSTQGLHQYLVFVGWSSNPRKLGIKHCYNRPCALYAVRAPIYASEASDFEVKESPNEDSPVLNLTESISSAFFPSFSFQPLDPLHVDDLYSPDGRFLVFLSRSCSVDSGAHSATDSFHRIDWPVKPVNGQLSSSIIIDVVSSSSCLSV
ncbi:SERINE PEPTIDASE S9 FAMILY MEMBER [Salix purpurea]|uniref:SERINE PEPTIDASE S9 FAMILY MEMBER n=1 Tax=Salix purpurea TaxID=77065 RepID=A0A9Q0Z977_SALPP|nr:SERINE PEPTIDASE S9 FAMILY MEMBER [Salix purpurea]